MWYDEQLEAQGYLLWSKKDLAEFGGLFEGKKFTLHNKGWEIIDMMSFSSSGMCKIAPAVVKEDLETKVSKILGKYSGNAILVFTDVETNEDIALLVIKDYDGDMSQWETIEKYSRKLHITAYPLDGMTRYYVEYGIRDDANRTQYIDVKAESDIKWIQ